MSSHLAGVPVAPDVPLYRGYLDRAAQSALVEDLRSAVREAPLFVPVMPRTGTPFSVRMTNLGPLGWVSDKERGYRYQPTHPVTGRPWPPIPAAILRIWETVTAYPHPPEACLVNFYRPEAKMGLHQDRDEADLTAPVVSISLGDSCRFRIGGTARRDRTRSFARRGWRFTGWTGSSPAHRPCWRRAGGSI